jgi:hypothetical protein
VRAFSRDDSRVGVLTGRRRRLTACGVPPGGTVPHVFDGFSGEGAGAPTTGARSFLDRPSLNAERCPLCVDRFAQAFPDSLNLLRLDTSGIHQAQRRMRPSHVGLVFWPPYGPELKPIERLWRDLNDAVAWQQCMRVEAPQDDVGQLWQAYDAPTLQALTGYPYWVEAMNALLT